jgi:probable rRNA maturation factor
MNAAGSPAQSGIQVAVSRQSTVWKRAPEAESVIRTAIVAAAGHVGSSTADVSVALVSDRKIQALNRSWRGVDRPTNVLSFPATRTHPADTFLGDIALAYETIAAEADSEGKPFPDHLSHLAVHGFLHLIGYDHGTEREAESMETLERAVLAELGIPDPYAPAIAGKRRVRTTA